MYTLLDPWDFRTFQVIMIPITVTMSKLGLVNTFGLILLYLTYAIPTDPLPLCRLVSKSLSQSLMKQQRSMGLISLQLISVYYLSNDETHACDNHDQCTALGPGMTSHVATLVLNRFQMWTLPLFQYNSCRPIFSTTTGPSFASLCGLHY